MQVALPPACAMTKAFLGIIGGSGVYEMPGVEDARWEKVASPWGEPSDAIRIGRIGKTDVAFLPRHGRGHRFSPSDINYRANIDALKRIGVTDVVSVTAVGSLKEDLPPGTFVLVDQFIDRTFARAKSFFGAGCVAHVSMAHPVSPLPRRPDRGRRRWPRASAAAAAAPTSSWRARSSPRSPSRASIARGTLDLIGMTAMPEAKLAREAEIAYATVAMVTDYDSWHPEHDMVDVASVIRVLNANRDQVQTPGRAASPATSRPSTSLARSAPTGRSTTRS